MDAADPILVKVLASNPLLTEADARAAYAWWSEDRRHPSESLVEFLSSQGVFAPDAHKSIEMLRKGVLTYCDPKRIFGETGHQRLREYAIRAGFIERPQYGQASAPAASAALASAGNPGASGGSKLSEVKEWLARRSASNLPTPTPPPAPAVTTTSVAPVGEMEVRLAGRAGEAPPGLKSRPLFPAKHSSGMSSSTIIPVGSSGPTVPTLRLRAPEVGDELGKYLLTEEIGRGGTAIVFRALNRSLNSPVAIKVLKVERDDDVLADQRTAEFLEQLKAEARLLAKFNHPNIVRVYDLEEGTSYPFLVLEYVDGLSLAEMLVHSGTVRQDRALKLLNAVAEGLAAAQRKIGLVHRDIKPANILLAKDGGVKLADLGLALTDDWIRSRGRQNLGVETSQILAGTAAYMAPEQALDSAQVDHRADIYSLGATFYHALTGEMPFKGRSRMELMFKHAKEMPIPPHEIKPDLNPRLSAVILRMMAKDPGQRHQSYDDLAADLAHALS